MLIKSWTSLIATAALAAAADPYDYIIVGGGTAGVALATRLSQGLPKARILLLEAGPAAPDELRINVPGMRGSALGSVYDWNFTTIPQGNLNGRSIDVNRGKVLGGSSALNYLCYDRASVAEYDAWGKLGNVGWGWNAMKTAMLKSENFTGNDGDLHGRTGPIQSAFTRVVPEVLETWQPALNKLGIPINTGASLGGKPIGVSFQPTNIDTTHWNRSYSANSYLPLAGLNLEVKTNSRVARIDFDAPTRRKGLRAAGVTMEDGTKFAARKEVILSAGSIQSPGLLELSGVGQSLRLKAAGITPVLDLPGVGENYQDHIRSSNTYRLKDTFSSFDPLIYDSSGPFATEQMRLWLANEPSWLDYTTVAYSFLNWGQVTDNATVSKLADAAVQTAKTTVDQQKLNFLRDPSVPSLEVIMEANYVGAAGYPGGGFITLISSIMHPMSRGSVHIDATNPLGKPIIDPKYLTNEYDLQAIIEGAKYSRKIAQTEPMASLWTAEFEPGPAVQTDEQWRAFALNATFSFFHPVGTCAMLPKKDGGVVGPSMIVHGTSNLRVVDASIIPVLISAHIQTAVYGIAEIAADLIIRGK